MDFTLLLLKSIVQELYLYISIPYLCDLSVRKTNLFI